MPEIDDAMRRYLAARPLDSVARAGRGCGGLPDEPAPGAGAESELAGSFPGGALAAGAS